jgi:hypothetical protein
MHQTSLKSAFPKFYINDMQMPPVIVEMLFDVSGYELLGCSSQAYFDCRLFLLPDLDTEYRTHGCN